MCTVSSIVEYISFHQLQNNYKRRLFTWSFLRWGFLTELCLYMSPDSLMILSIKIEKYENYAKWTIHDVWLSIRLNYLIARHENKLNNKNTVKCWWPVFKVEKCWSRAWLDLVSVWPKVRDGLTHSKKGLYYEIKLLTIWVCLKRGHVYEAVWPSGRWPCGQN